ncbi:hypothetical protein [Treponema sp.]|uniref:hypothetical protein n=1 Tax=Treponema sp. TaxID=166 RepID=UPI00388FC3C1
MKNTDGKCKIYRTLIIIFTTLCLFTVFSACSDGGGGSGSSETVTKYSYNLTSYENYYRVNVFYCIETESNSYYVKSYEIHLFSKTNSNYKNKAGNELCDMVRTKAVTASSSENKTQASATTTSATNSSTGVKTTYNIPAGLEYTVYYYF